MDTDTTTSHADVKPLAGPSCSRTGLSKPECHCQDCLRDLVARFAPAARG